MLSGFSRGRLSDAPWIVFLGHLQMTLTNREITEMNPTMFLLPKWPWQFFITEMTSSNFHDDQWPWPSRIFTPPSQCSTDGNDRHQNESISRSLMNRWHHVLPSYGLSAGALVVPHCSTHATVNTTLGNVLVLMAYALLLGPAWGGRRVSGGRISISMRGTQYILPRIGWIIPICMSR